MELCKPCTGPASTFFSVARMAFIEDMFLSGQNTKTMVEQSLRVQLMILTCCTVYT
jgi:hypothetical protein